MHNTSYQGLNIDRMPIAMYKRWLEIDPGKSTYVKNARDYGTVGLCVLRWLSAVRIRPMGTHQPLLVNTLARLLRRRD